MMAYTFSVKSNQALKLEAESPADREAKRAANLRYMREKNRQARAEARAAGILPVVIDLPQQQLEELDALKQRAGLRNRSQAILRILAALEAHPQLKQELGL